MEKGMGLEALKKEYEKFQTKYGLPSFKEMNEDFHIEKIAETETEVLLWEIRRMTGDKLANYMRFLENLLNPVNVPMFFYSIVKALNQEEKKIISEAYKKLIKNEIRFIERDLEFNEKDEAEFIKDSYEMWQEIKKELGEVIRKVEKDVDLKTEPSNSKNGYFG